MYLNPGELESGIYGHVIDTIVQDDRDIVQQSIDAAVEEVKAYLAVRYDNEAIFAQEGAARNALILESVKVVAIWNLIKLSSAETLYTTWLDRYDRVIKTLQQIAAGKIAPDLPLLTDARGNVTDTLRFGANKKFNHYF
jgi:phage gp36-like protein